MPVKIAHIQSRSLAAKAGIKAGEMISSINGMRIRDFYDLELYASDYELQIELLDFAGNTRQVTIHRTTAKPLGIEPEPYQHRNCCNNCVFCFIDQMPPGMRETLYNKDDDYLYSQIFGNYITLTNLSSADIDRIIRQHIGPLYISVHSTDDALRRQMMRFRQDFQVLPLLRRFAEAGLSYHVQIVCVPGYNDKAALQSSILDLLDEELATLSIGVVPVGLTRFRKQLTELQPFDRDSATEVLDDLSSLRAQTGTDIIYAADEFFVLAERDVPAARYYNDYPQLENGIGMIRLMLTNFRRKKRAFLKELHKHRERYLLVCSTSALPSITSMVADLNAMVGAELVRVQSARNDFFGEHISVSGLLTYCDLKDQIKMHPEEALILPANILNDDLLSLDGVTADALKEAFGGKVLMVDPVFTGWFWL